jgi:hypothetical protein
MRTENKKGNEIEVPIFKEFVSHSNLPIILDSIEKRTPPEPDILCKNHSGETVAFELVEICDRNMASVMARPEKENISYIRTSDPSLEIIQKKLKKKYETQFPINLLCYTHGRVVSPDSFIIEVITPFFDEIEHQFKQAWLYGRKGIYHLWPKQN